MGSNGNIYVKSGDGSGVYLYTASYGDKLPKLLKNALIRGRDRWGDTPSLTRIIFGELIQKDVLNNTGFGISTQLVDNDNFILVVDDKAEKVGIFGEAGHCYKTFTFEQFIAMNDSQLSHTDNLTGYRFLDEAGGANQNTGDPYPFTRTNTRRNSNDYYY